VPVTIPPFVQYQQPLYPLRGLWNAAPREGDRFVSAEIDWGVTTVGQGSIARGAVQFDLSGNSPVAFSQIVAFSVDNSRCGADVDFLFPDSAGVLTVPGYNQVVSPVFTNALMFYASAPAAAVGDVTIFQVLNSMPPPLALTPSLAQTQVVAPGIVLTSNATTVLVPAPVSGTIEAFSLAYSYGTGGTATVAIQDGRPVNLWNGQVAGVSGGSGSTNMSGLRARFINGLNLVVTGTTFGGTAVIVANVYYSIP
jgi:hypothetical protein